MHLFHICTEYIQKKIFSDEKLKWETFYEKEKNHPLTFLFYTSNLKF